MTEKLGAMEQIRNAGTNLWIAYLKGTEVEQKIRDECNEAMENITFIRNQTIIELGDLERAIEAFEKLETLTNA